MLLIVPGSRNRLMEHLRLMMRDIAARPGITARTLCTLGRQRRY